jgi:hypothetical protein
MVKYFALLEVPVTLPELLPSPPYWPALAVLAAQRRQVAQA